MDSQDNLMPYYILEGRCYIFKEENGEEFDVMMLAVRPDAKVVFCSILKNGDRDSRINFCPIHMDILLGYADPVFDGVGTPNLETLAEQMNYYKRICDDQGVADTYFTCSLSQLWKYSRQFNMPNVPMIFPATSVLIQNNQVAIDK